MSARTYSIIAVADQERPVSGDVYLVARIGPHCANAEEAALWYARGMRQRERSVEDAFDAGRRCAPSVPPSYLVPIMAMGISFFLGLGAGILIGGGFSA
ncbi:MAG TPA: hypothetical protein VLD59_19540 [Steroidobacteraceae bacterium]|nr:hypothetical protein [Steroidobacteraceae bacterium]